MRALSCNKQRWLNRQRDHRRQKGLRTFFEYKMKCNTTWFSQENLKSYEDVITNCKFGEFYFYCKICFNDGLCIAMVLQLILSDIVSQKREKERRVYCFLFCKLHNKKMQKQAFLRIQKSIFCSPSNNGREHNTFRKFEKVQISPLKTFAPRQISTNSVELQTILKMIY